MKVAVVQTRWADDPADGLRNARQAIEDATVGGDIDMICFPEFLLGPPWYMPGQDHLRGVTDTPVPSPVIDGFQDLARRRATSIVLGSIVEDLCDGMYRNVSLLIDRNGTIVGRAVKAHAFGNEMVVCRQAEALNVMETEFGRIGIAVCSDFWVPEVIRLMAVSGARTIFVPGGTLRQNQSLMVNALSTAAYLNGVNIVYASSVGVVRGRRGDRVVEIHFTGTSLVASPDGVVAQAGSDKPEILIVDLDRRVGGAGPSLTDADRWHALRRPDGYRALLGPYTGARRDLAAELRTSLSGTDSGDDAAAAATIEGASVAERAVS